MSLRAFLCALLMFACTAVPALARHELVTDQSLDRQALEAMLSNRGFASGSS
jgi:hypothetical protein